MMRTLLLLALLALLGGGAPALAASAIDAFDFADAQTAARYQRLLAEFRCPKCLNESLASSGAPIAVDLRRAVRRLLDAGQSDDAIRAYLQERYGDFVLYDPPLRPSTWLLWFSPLLLALVAAIALARMARRGPPTATTAERRDAHLLMRNSE